MTDFNKQPEKISENYFLRELRKSIGVGDQIKDEIVEAKEPTDEAKRYYQKMNLSNQPITLTAKQLFRQIKSSHYISNNEKIFYKVDEHNELVIKKLCLYFSGDERMFEYGMNPDKGIALIGGLGVGKTWLMKILRYNSRIPYGFINCSDITDKCEQGGSEEISKYFHIAKTMSPHLYYGKTEIGFCFNELGREPMPVKYFGNPTNVMERILFTRYENGIPRNFTHFTSNRNDFKEIYGDYISDRMNEMFNIVYFPETAKSRR